jgi:hypothetical protein
MPTMIKVGEEPPRTSLLVTVLLRTFIVPIKLINGKIFSPVWLKGGDLKAVAYSTVAAFSTGLAQWCTERLIERQPTPALLRVPAYYAKRGGDDG